MSRRELGQLAAGLAVTRALPLGAQAGPPVSYIGPLTGVEGLADRQFDPVAIAHDVYAAAPRRLRFQARTRADAEAWQRTLHTKLTELVGAFPAERSPLHQ